MKQEDIKLLLKDLSARIPYGVICRTSHTNESTLTELDVENECAYFEDCDENILIIYIKPYLRPMSSMTEEEKKEYRHFIAFSGNPDGAANLVEWLNKKMFAYRTVDGKDMFELGLALEASEGMYV